MLAAQAAFLSDPWAGFHEKYDQLIRDDPKIIGHFSPGTVNHSNREMVPEE
jgi:hypothetical protein